MARADQRCARRNAAVESEAAPVSLAILSSDTTENVSYNESLVGQLQRLAGESTAGRPLTGLANGFRAATQTSVAVTNNLVGKDPLQAQQYLASELRTEQQLASDATALQMPACSQTALTLGGSTAAREQLLNKALHPPAPKKKTTGKGKGKGKGNGKGKGSGKGKQAHSKH